MLNEPAPLPCTPNGILTLLRRYGVEIKGAEVVVVGRGVTIGRPMPLRTVGQRLVDGHPQRTGALVTRHRSAHRPLAVAEDLSGEHRLPVTVQIGGGRSLCTSAVTEPFGEMVAETLADVARFRGGLGILDIETDGIQHLNGGSPSPPDALGSNVLVRNVTRT